MSTKKHKKFTLYIPHSPKPMIWNDLQHLASAVAKELGAEGAVITAATGLWRGEQEAISTITIIAEATQHNMLMVSAFMESFGKAYNQVQVLHTMEDIEVCFVDL